MTESERQRHLWDLAGRVAGTYGKDGVINRIGEKDLPSQAAIVSILQQLLAVVFPGYHGEPVPCDVDLHQFAALHLDRLDADLAAVLTQTLRFSRRHGFSCAELWSGGEGDYPPDTEISRLAQQLVLEYLDHLPVIRASLPVEVQP